ncbi:hypothetical protein RIF29_22271 [Crotalaria pallida]|uniref:Uncharacterized protein n=1 Tax=Crotalaria pallida TaxID=3830 RepID=A0AAN9F6T6_CROPI
MRSAPLTITQQHKFIIPFQISNFTIPLSLSLSLIAISEHKSSNSLGIRFKFSDLINARQHSSSTSLNSSVPFSRVQLFAFVLS